MGGAPRTAGRTRRRYRPDRARLRGAVLAALLAVPLAGPPAVGVGGEVGELLYVSEGNRLQRFDVDTLGSADVRGHTLIDNADAAPPGGDRDPEARFRDVNGMVCPLPDGSGRFVAGEDTGQPSPPAGWGVFEPGGTQVGKLSATYLTGNPEPFGCAFHPDGTLFTTEVGDQGLAGANGQLIVWFPPFDRFPGPPGAYPDTDAASTHFCKIDTAIGNATGLAVDAQGRVYVASPNGFSIFRYTGPFPTSVAGCTDVDPLGSPQAVGVTRERIVQEALVGFFTGLALSPWNTLVAASVLNGNISEYTLDGVFLRALHDPPEDLPPISTGNPQGLAFDGAGTLYYTDLDLVGDFPDVGPGPDGRLWRIRFDASADPPEPQAPEVMADGLSFPDGLGVLEGDLEPAEWRTYGGSRERTFFNRAESIVTPDNVDELVVKWRVATGAIVTGSPVVALIEVGPWRVQVAYALSWDGVVYAVHAPSGVVLWRFQTEDQPGANFPYAGSAHVERIDGREVVLIGAGEILYALDAITGAELWRFTAGTGCRDANGDPPGLCAFDGERNEIETSPLVMDGRIYFGMDVNEGQSGKGGFYALDLATGALDWFFDLESGRTCRPWPGDEVRRFDGYHDAGELGLPADFFATRPGCDFDRTSTGCGNVWSSAAGDAERGLVIFASSNCDTDDDPDTTRPPPPMPPFDEAVIALHTDGSVAWRWRPREVDNADLAFGATPNLFDVEVDGQRHDAVGVGNKDGTYYVLPRDGVNPVSGVRWDDADPSALPFWSTRVVEGGFTGGVIGSAAVDRVARRIHFATAPGRNPLDPQQPTQHALDMDTGAVVWDNAGAFHPFVDSSFAPASGLRGVVFQGSVLNPELRAYRSILDEASLVLARRLNDHPFGSAVASGAAVVNGVVIVGAGVGTRTDDPEDLSDITSRLPTDLVALCVPGTPGCRAHICGPGAEVSLAAIPVAWVARRRRRKSG